MQSHNRVFLEGLIIIRLFLYFNFITNSIGLIAIHSDDSSSLNGLHTNDWNGGKTIPTTTTSPQPSQQQQRLVGRSGGCGGAHLGLEGHAQRQVGCDLQEGDLAVCVLQQGRRGVRAVHQDDLEAMAMAQVTQLAGKVHVRWRKERRWGGQHTEDISITDPAGYWGDSRGQLRVVPKPIPVSELAVSGIAEYG